MKHKFLLLISMIGCASCISAQRSIDLQDYQVLVAAVQEKVPTFKGSPSPTKESVEALAAHVEHFSAWQECYPPRGCAIINGQRYQLRGEIACIMYDWQDANWR